MAFDNLTPTKNTTRVPPRILEYAYYAVIVYAFLGEAWGLAVPLLGAGGLAVLAVCCVLGPWGKTILGLLKLPLGCVISVLLLHLIIHAESQMPRSFFTWALSLLVVQTLSFRPGFMHRFALVAVFIGLGTLPFLEYQTLTSDLARIGGGEGTGLTNGNALAMWFGFCSVYFFIVGIETRRMAARSAAWLTSVGCLFVVGLTVSRGPLAGVAIAITFALRRLLKRGFLPVLALLLLSWIAFVSGVFDSITAYYLARGAEESGRGILWPSAFEGFVDSWAVGVGVSHAVMPLPSGYLAGPHNGFLYIALASGIVPLALFLGYWIKAAKGAYRAIGQGLPDAPFQTPLFMFAFLEMMILDTAFMSPWLIVVLSSVMATDSGLQVLSSRFRNRQTLPARSNRRPLPGRESRSSAPFGQDLRY